MPGSKKLEIEDETTIEIKFENGQAVAIDNEEISHVNLIHSLNRIGSKYAIGRGIHVGDTVIGLKGRIAFEAPAALLLIKAHELLEKHVLSKWQIQIKSQLATTYGNLLHEGLYLDTACRDIEKYLESSQQRVSGSVKIKLMPYFFELLGVNSPYDMHSHEFGDYGEASKLYSSSDAKGFINLYSLPIQLQYLTKQD